MINTWIVVCISTVLVLSTTAILVVDKYMNMSAVAKAILVGTWTVVMSMGCLMILILSTNWR